MPASSPQGAHNLNPCADAEERRRRSTTWGGPLKSTTLERRVRWYGRACIAPGQLDITAHVTAVFELK